MILASMPLLFIKRLPGDGERVRICDIEMYYVIDVRNHTNDAMTGMWGRRANQSQPIT